MKRDAVDFHELLPNHYAVHARLENWARWVLPRRPYWIAPMWRQAKSAQHWEAVSVTVPVDTMDGMAVEKIVAKLPEKHRDALRWSYVYRTHPRKACRMLGVNGDGLRELVNQGRQMVVVLT